MIRDYSYWIIPVYKNSNWDYEFLIINQKTYNWSFWWFPKWHSEKWETELESAKRELEEEVWIKNININTKKTLWFSYNFEEKWIKYDKTVKYWIWFVKDKNVIIQKEELNGYKRTNYNDTINMLSHKNMKEVFKKITKDLFVIK